MMSVLDRETLEPTAWSNLADMVFRPATSQPTGWAPVVPSQTSPGQVQLGDSSIRARFHVQLSSTSHVPPMCYKDTAREAGSSAGPAHEAPHARAPPSKQTGTPASPQPTHASSHKHTHPIPAAASASRRGIIAPKPHADQVARPPTHTGTGDNPGEAQATKPGPPSYPIPAPPRCQPTETPKPRPSTHPPHDGPHAHACCTFSNNVVTNQTKKNYVGCVQISMLLS